jgi:hypothetical protein
VIYYSIPSKIVCVSVGFVDPKGEVKKQSFFNSDEEQLLKDSHKPLYSEALKDTKEMSKSTDPKFYAEMIMLLRKEVDCLYALAFPESRQQAIAVK